MKHERIIYPSLYITVHTLFYRLCLYGQLHSVRVLTIESYIETNKTANGACREVALFYV
jgi:hypothetical protein